MIGMKFEFQDLDLDEGGVQTEMVITFHDGSASYILNDEEMRDLVEAARQRMVAIARPPEQRIRPCPACGEPPHTYPEACPRAN